MKRFLLIILTVVILFPSVAVCGEKVSKKRIAVVATVPAAAVTNEKEFVKTVPYQQGENETREQAETSAKSKLRNQAMREIGEYVESSSGIKDLTLEKDEISAISVAVIKIKEPCSPKYNAENYLTQMTCAILVDTADMEKRISELSTIKRELLKKNDELSKMAKETKTEQVAYEAARENLMKEISVRQALLAHSKFLEDQMSKSIEREKNYIEKIEELKNADKARGVSPESIRLKYQEGAKKLESEALLDNGLRNFSSGTSSGYQESIKYFSDAVKINPNFSEAYVARAYAYFILDLFDFAINDCNTAIKIDPRNASAYALRGRIHFEMRESNNAIAALNKAIELEPNTVSNYLYRGLVYQEKKQYSHSIQDYNEAIAKNPNYKDAYFLRGKVYFSLREKNMGCRSYVMALGFSDSKEATTKFNECLKGDW